jgi:hypothetical protein
MDTMSTLRADVFRSVVTILIPGLFAISPFVGMLLYWCPGMARFAEANQGTSSLLVLLAALAWGHVLEDLGAWIEKDVWDPCLKRRKRDKYPNLEEEWNKYLRLAFKDEPVGHEYLRTIQMRMKFELNCAVSVPFFFVGLVCFNCVADFFSCLTMLLIVAGALSVGVYLLWESYRSCGVLARVRQELLKGLVIVKLTEGPED